MPETPHPTALKRLEDLCLLGLVAGLVTVWLALWSGWVLRVFDPARGGPFQLPYLIALLVLGGAEVTRRSLRRPGGSLRRARGVVGLAGAGALALSLALAFPAQLVVAEWYLWPNLGALAVKGTIVFAADLCAWWYGIQLGRAPIGHHTLAGAFFSGILALSALLLANSLHPALSGADVVLPLLLFFTLGLGGLALTSLRRLRLQQRSVALTQASLTRYWVVTAVAVIGLVLAVGLIAAQVLAPEALERLASSAGLLFYAGAFVLAVMVTPLILLIAGVLGPLLPQLVAALRTLAAVIDRLAAFVRQLLAGLSGLMARRWPRLALAEQLRALVNSPAAHVTGRWSVVVLVLAVGVIVFWLAVRRLGMLTALNEDELRDSIFSTQLLWSQLKGLFGRRRRPTPPPDPFLTLAGPADDARLIVRRAYQGMLEWAQSASLPRAAGQTPRAYGESLAGAVPQAREAIRLLTGAYLLARYAAEAPSLAEARQAEHAAAQLRAIAPEAVNQA